MKQNKPAGKKSFSPFKESKNESNRKFAGGKNSDKFSFEKSNKTFSDYSANFNESKRFSKADQPFKKHKEDNDFNKEDNFKKKKTFEASSDKPRFKKDDDFSKKRSSEGYSKDKKGFSSDKPRFKKDDDFSKKRSPEGYSKDRKEFSSDKPRFKKDDDFPKKRSSEGYSKDRKEFSSDRKPKKSYDKDDTADFDFGKEKFSNKKESAFHGSDDNGAKRVKKSAYGKPLFDKGFKNPERDTPSGFNRQKYLDTANERFADKQARKEEKRKVKNDASEAQHESVPGEMPLNKYIAHCGLCSRRKAVDFIKEGKVTVNGQVITEPAHKVSPADDVKLSNKKIKISKNLVYILLNKPKGFITTTDDPEGRKTVMELITDASDQRVYPVGRLDRNTSGLLLLTNDGDLAQKLAHPSNNIKKIYHVELDKALLKPDAEKIVEGLVLEDGPTQVDALGYVDPKDKKQLGIEIHSGKNRIVRRIFEHLGYEVEKLDRVMYAGLTKKNLPRGKWRLLTEKEVILLKHFK
ncbi:23S rRNA pseudouridine2605 synthase [Chitinophaga skermanii]|uniref:Pseudouridine synthase n=1 Tax=Chitinophaga skermanii TaxID=331697 RepID=A0A327R1W1_9BACT|nr:pseudouridine synthase [Chitinophaga skermanii]RAJ10631.1 23S rRNA pseudouridine2605 synthase [Chitinophaga skermanii]